MLYWVKNYRIKQFYFSCFTFLYSICNDLNAIDICLRYGLVRFFTYSYFYFEAKLCDKCDVGEKCVLFDYNTVKMTPDNEQQNICHVTRIWHVRPATVKLAACSWIRLIWDFQRIPECHNREVKFCVELIMQ